MFCCGRAQWAEIDVYSVNKTTTVAAWTLQHLTWWIFFVMLQEKVPRFTFYILYHPFSYRPVYLARAHFRSVTFHRSAWCRKKSEKVNTLATIVVLKKKRKRPALWLVTFIRMSLFWQWSFSASWVFHLLSLHTLKPSTYSAIVWSLKFATGTSTL